MASSPRYHRITCSCCENDAWVPRNRRFLCDLCYHNDGRSHDDKLTYDELNGKINRYLERGALSLAAFGSSGR